MSKAVDGGGMRTMGRWQNVPARAGGAAVGLGRLKSVIKVEERNKLSNTLIIHTRS